MKSVFLPRFTYGIGAFNEISDYLSPNAKVALFYGEKAYKASTTYIEDALHSANLDVVARQCYGHEATYENVEKIKTILANTKVEALLALGGGKCLDTVKLVGDQLSIPVFTFPTIASTCAATTRISIMYNEDGSFKDIPKLKQAPIHTFIEPRIIAQAPIKYLWAGIGDTMAKHIESVFSARGDVLDYSSELGIQIGYNCYYPLLRDGQKALEDASHFMLSDELERVIQGIIVTTGAVSLSVHPDYNSALAHALFYGLTLRECVEKEHLHGEVVSYGILVQLMLDKQKELLAKSYAFHKAIGLPTSLKELGLDIDSDLNDVLEKTVTNQELEHIPYPITKEMIYQAMCELEKYRL